MNPRRVGSTVGMLVLVAAAAAWAYYTNVVAAPPAMDMNMRVTSGDTAFPVELAAAERARITGTVTYTGSVVPFNEEDVFPRVTGRIIEMPVYPGDVVRAGQVVARLDDVELGSRVREAEAGTLAAEANVAQMEADVLAARHGIAQMEREVAMAAAEAAAARDSVAQMEKEVVMVAAEAEHQEHLIVRDERLHKSGAISLQDLEATRAMVSAARAKVDAARSKVSQMKAMVTAAEAKLDAARARLERERAMESGALRKRDAMAAMAAQSRAMRRTAEVVRDYVTIRTPTNGYVVKRLMAPGVVVQPGMAILKIAQIDRVRLQGNVGEKDLPSIKVGTPVRVTMTDGSVTSTRVTSVFPFVDPGGRTAVVEAVVDNGARRFLPGQYVTMQFVTGERLDGVSVPRNAISRLGGKASLWVVKDGKAERREVVTGLEDAERIEIRQGIEAGQQVIARGHESLYDGARVTDASRRAPGSGHGGHGAQPPAAPAEGAGTNQKAAPAEEKEKGHAGH